MGWVLEVQSSLSALLAETVPLNGVLQSKGWFLWGNHGKPMGKPLRPYSGIVWLVKLDIEMWDDSCLFENLISHLKHISYCQNVVFLNRGFQPLSSFKVPMWWTSPVECDLLWGPTNPTTSLQLLPGTAQVGRAQTAQIRSTHQSLGKRVHSDIFNPNALLESNLKY